MRKVVIAIAVLSLALSGVGFVAAPASALDVPPSLNPASYEIAVESSVLAAAAAGVPTSAGGAPAAGADMANDVNYSAEWQTFVEKYGAGDPSEWTGVTSADSATIAELESQFAVPATAEATMTVGDAVPMVGAVLVGGKLGATADTLFGIDVTNNLCEPPAGSAGSSSLDIGAGADALLRAITLTDCSGWKPSAAMADNINGDAPLTSMTGGKICFASSPTTCIQLIGVGNQLSYGNGTKSNTFCYSATGPAGVGATWQGTYTGGTTVNFSVVPGDSNPSLCGAYAGGDQSISAAPNTNAPYKVLTQYGCAGGTGCGSATMTPVSVNANPTRKYRCITTNVDGTTEQADSANFTEEDSSFPVPVSPAIPHGEVAASEICELLGGPSPIPMMSPMTTTSPYRSWATANPGCDDGSCPLVLEKGSQNCFTAVPADLCENWVQDPTKTTDYSCLYNGVAVALSECYVYGNTYNPALLAGGDPYADPGTGLDTGSTTGGSTDQSTFAAPIQSPNAPRQCFPQGWGALNPISWVFMPLQCAFEWAFVPRNSVLKADGLKLRSVVGASAVGSVMGVLTGISTFSIDGSGCSGIAWTFSIAGLSKTVDLLAACSGDPLAPTAAVVKTVLTAVVITVGVLASARYIAQIFGYVGYGGIVDAERRQEYRDQARERRSGGSGVGFK